MKITFRRLSLVIRYSDMDSRLDEEGVLKKEEKDKTCKVRAWGCHENYRTAIEREKDFLFSFFHDPKEFKK